MLADTVHHDRVEENITPKKFWDIYFNQKFIALQRNTTCYEGAFLDYSSANKSLFVQFPKIVKFTSTFENLRKYCTDDDKRFKRSQGIVDALIDELNSSDEKLSQVQSATHILESWCDAPKQDFETFEDRLFSLSKSLKVMPSLEVLLLKYLDTTAVKEIEYRQYEEDGQMDRLHVEKVIFLKALIYSGFTSDIRYLLVCAASPWEYREVAETSISLIGRCNRKEDIIFLISLLEKNELQSRHAVIVKALQYICSGSYLIRDRKKDREASFWRNALTQLPYNQDEWLYHDAESIFWEKRYHATEKLIMQGKMIQKPDLIARLKNDEVAAIRDVVQRY